MSAGSASFVAFIVEQLAGMAPLHSKPFFGGTGLLCGDTQFAMLMGNTLYFAVNDTTRPQYEQMGSQCFAYDTKARRVQVKKYYAVPTEVIEDSEALRVLARQALEVAWEGRRSGPRRGGEHLRGTTDR